MSKLPKKSLLVILLTILLVGAVGFGVQRYFSSRNSVDTPKDEWSDGINYRQPTEEEQKTGDEKKRELSDEGNEAEQNEKDKPSHKVKKNTTVLITDAAQYGDMLEVRSFMPHIYQNGTCTLVFSQGSSKITKTAPAYADSSNTVCTNPEIKRSEFSTAGEWKVTVSYESKDAIGKSEERTITLR